MSSNSYNLGRVVPIFKGDYGDQTQYNYLDVVLYDGGSYVCKEATIGHIPTDTNFWQLVASGSKITPEQIDQIVDQVMKEVGDKVVVDPEYVHTDNNLTDELLDRINDIPVVNDSIITIMQGEEVSGTFSLNQEGDATIHLKESVETVTWDKVEDKPEFANVAMSGDYNDLNSVPEIPVVNDATITIKQGEQSQSFKLNQEGDATIELSEIPVVNDAKITIKQGEKEQSFTLNQEGDATIELEAGGSVTWDDVENKPNITAFYDEETEVHAERWEADIIELACGGYLGISTCAMELAGDGVVSITSNDVLSLSGSTSVGIYSQDSVTSASNGIDLEGSVAQFVVYNSATGEYDSLGFEGEGLAKISTNNIELESESLTWNEDTIATEGYVDDKIEAIPTANDAKITIKQGEKEQSFTLNQEGDATIELDAGGSVTWDDIEGKPNITTFYDEDAKVHVEQWTSNVLFVQGGESTTIAANNIKLVGGSATWNEDTVATEGYVDEKIEAVLGSVNDALETI